MLPAHHSRQTWPFFTFQMQSKLSVWFVLWSQESRGAFFAQIILAKTNIHSNLWGSGAQEKSRLMLRLRLQSPCVKRSGLVTLWGVPCALFIGMLPVTSSPPPPLPCLLAKIYNPGVAGRTNKQSLIKYKETGPQWHLLNATLLIKIITLNEQQAKLQLISDQPVRVGVKPDISHCHPHEAVRRHTLLCSRSYKVVLGQRS